MNLGPLQTARSPNPPQHPRNPPSRCDQGGAPERSKPRPSNLLRLRSRQSRSSMISPPVSTHPQADAIPAKIQKSELTISEPRRHRDKTHLKFVASQPCLVCGRSPADAHHLRFMQSRAMGRKVSDEFTVPLCRTHHRDNHSFGDEVAWWERRAIDPIATSRMLWISTRRMEILTIRVCVETRRRTHSPNG